MADPVADGRDRRQSMAQQMLGLADDWEAEYDGDEDLNPNNIPKPVNDEQEDRLAVYYSVAELGGTPQPRADVPFGLRRGPAGTCTGGPRPILDGPNSTKNGRPR
jgi:hypothetical protein